MKTNARNLLIFIAITLGISLGGSGCSDLAERDSVGDPAVVVPRSEPLWFGTNAKRWPVTGGFGLTSIKVCFDPAFPFPEVAGQVSPKIRIRDLIESNWERVAFIDFYGWENCVGSVTNMIRVGYHPEITSGENGSSPVGWNQGNTNDIKLTKANPATHTILHEFGHSLGFEHEYQSAATCAPRTSGAISLESEHDGLSVMDTPCLGTPTQISPWDIMGVQRKYGQKPSGSIVGLGARCANIWGNTPALDTPILSLACSGQPNDTFFRDTDASVFRAFLTGAQRCLNVQNGMPSPTGFTPLVSQACSPSGPAQQFGLTGVDWIAMGGLCVSPIGTTAGAHLKLDNCGFAKWDFFPASGKIRLNGTNLCVNTTAGINAPAIGTEVALAECSSSNNVHDTFVFWQGRILVNIQLLDLCFNVFGGTTTLGNRIGIWNGCFANPPIFNSVFRTRGQIQAMGLCVDMAGGNPGDGLPIGVFPCHTGQNQRWEYYW